MGLDHKKEILEWVIHEVELYIDWAKEIRTTCGEYLKLMTDYDMSVVELDQEKIRPLFHKKMENGTTNELTLDFMGFVAQAFAQSKQVMKNTCKCDKDWDVITD